ncbi:MAG: hypothetical protein JNK51_11940, partial [Blastocatellia bacterium]|nr:hypothetical protein [Blastocatellia bacterium]
EKVLAAHRAGISRIILPAQNESDIDDIPEDVRKELEIIPAHRVSDVLKAALEEGVEETKTEEFTFKPNDGKPTEAPTDQLIAREK